MDSQTQSLQAAPADCQKNCAQAHAQRNANVQRNAHAQRNSLCSKKCLCSKECAMHTEWSIELWRYKSKGLVTKKSTCELNQSCFACSFMVCITGVHTFAYIICAKRFTSFSFHSVLGPFHTALLQFCCSTCAARIHVVFLWFTRGFQSTFYYVPHSGPFF